MEERKKSTTTRRYNSWTRQLKDHFSEFYKNLFGPPTPNHFGMIETENSDIPQLLVEENRILRDIFLEKEVHDAIMQMENNKA
jgi:hypothetical protein